MQSIYESAPFAMAVISRDEMIVEANWRFEHLLGYERGALIGAALSRIVPPSVTDHGELVEAFFEMPVERGMSARRAISALAADGREQPVEVSLYPTDRDGETMVVALLVDLRESQNQEARFRLALDASSSGMIMVDASGTILLANARAHAMFGYPPGGLPGETVERLIPEAKRRRHAVLRASFHHKPHVRSMGETTNLVARRRDGAEMPVEVALTPMEGPDGPAVMATVIDLTAARQAAHRLSAANQELNAANDDLIRLVYSASHDLKAPLLSIAGLLSFVEQDIAAGDDADALANARRASEKAQLLADRIEKLMGVVRVEGRSLVVETVSVALMIDRIWEYCRVESSDAPRLVTRLDTVETVHTDPVLLESALSNLVSNAVKYSDPDKQDRWVEIVAEKNRNEIVFIVSDNGIGIPVKNQGDVFRMFTRFSDRDVPGSGLGLALVKKTVEKLNGTISFESSAAGTSFKLTLPRDEGDCDVSLAGGGGR